MKKLLNCLTAAQLEIVEDCTIDIVNGGNELSSDTFEHYARLLSVPVEVMQALHRANCLPDQTEHEPAEMSSDAEQLFDE